MTEKNPTRRDLMKPVHLLGWSFAAAVFAGFVTAMAMGAFTDAGGDIVANAAASLRCTVADYARFMALMVHARRADGPGA